MASKFPILTVVLLAGANAAAVEALRPAAEILASFGLGAVTAVLPPDAPLPPLTGGVCAVIVASPDAALPAALARHTSLPVIRVPDAGEDHGGAALLNDGQGNLPAGPDDGGFATMAIGEAGAKNAALFVVASLAGTDERLRTAWAEFRARQTEVVLQSPPLERKD